MLEWLFGSRARIDADGVSVGDDRVPFDAIVDALVDDDGVALVLGDGTRRLARVAVTERPAFAAAVLASLAPAADASPYRSSPARDEAPREARHVRRKLRQAAGQPMPLRWPRGLS